MILSAAALACVLSTPQQAKIDPPDTKPVNLSRVFRKGEKLQYSVESSLHVEEKPYPLQTFMPDDLDLNYKFTTEVTDMRNDGVAVIHYLRPNMVQVEGENAEHGLKTTVDKIDLNFDLTMSPINQVLEEKDLRPKKKKKPTDTGNDDGGQPLMFARAGGRQGLGAFLGQFIGELYRLALNVGSLDSSLDLAPKLPLDDVKIGDPWKTTVSYEPQKLKGKDGKMAVQRLDYTLTYKGVVTVNGKQYYRIHAALDLNTDLAAFINQLAGDQASETNLKSIPMTLKQNIDYDLDMATKRTVAARSYAEGGFKINTNDLLDEPIVEEKLTGTTQMHLIAIGAATPTPKKSGGHAH